MRAARTALLLAEMEAIIVRAKAITGEKPALAPRPDPEPEESGLPEESRPSVRSRTDTG